jgi:hypothetical protein
MKSVRKRLTYANVMSSIAVFLVLGGATAFAATELGKNTVGTKQLKKGAVSLAKINVAAKSALKGAIGPQGPAGKAGADGKNGTNGKDGTNGTNGAVQGYSATHTASVNITANSFATIVSKQLPAGNYIVNGTVGLTAVDSAASPQTSDDSCRLVAGATVSPEATWISPQGTVFIFHAAETAVSMQMPLTLGAATTVSLQCQDNLNSPPGTFETTASEATLTAVQTSANS